MNVTEMNAAPTPQWIKDTGKEIQQRYNLNDIESVFIAGIIAKHCRINKSKQMNTEDLRPNTKVRNLKYGNIETILHTGIMKLDSGWIDCVVYQGQDRFSGKTMVFTKRTDDFLKEFELI